MKYATKRLLDSVWTVAFTVTKDGKATIHGYSRDCQLGYDLEGDLPVCRLIEGPGREVKALDVKLATEAGSRSTLYQVSNPRHVFSYGEVQV